MDTITSRRTVLRRALQGGAVVTIGSAVVPVAGFFQPAAGQAEDKPPTEPELAAFAAQVELVAAAAYDQAAGRLSPAAQQAVGTFGGHHREHAARFAAAAGDKATGQPNPRLAQIVSDQLRDAPNEQAVTKVLYDIESALAGTHLYSLGQSTEAPALVLTASVLPVESAHAARLGLLAGLPLAPADDTPQTPSVVPPFETEEKRLDPAIYNPTEESE